MRIFSRPSMMALHGVILLLLLGGALFFRAHRGELRAEIRSDLRTIARLKASEIESWLHERRADAAVLSEDADLRKQISRYLTDNSPQAKEHIRHRLSSLKEHYEYANILLADADGNIRLALMETNEVLKKDVRSALRAALARGRTRSVDLHTAEEGAPPHTSVIAPVVEELATKTRHLAALVLISNAEDFLYPLIQQWPTDSESAESILVRRDGEDVLFLNDLRHRENAALQLRLPLSRTDLPAVKAVQGAKGWVEGQDYRGEKVLAVVLPIRNSPWFMVAKIDADEALSVLRRESFLIVAAGLGLIALIWVGAVLIFQRQAASHYEELYQHEAFLRQAKQRDSVILKSIGDAVIATDGDARVEMMNAAAEELTGWSASEAAGEPATSVFRIINEETRKPVESPITRVFREGMVVGLANHTLLLTRNDDEVPIADSGAPIRGSDGLITGAVLVFRDQTNERNAWQRERHLREVLLGIRNVNQSIIKADEPNWLAERACEHLTQTFGYRTAWIALLGEDGTTVEHVAGTGLGNDLNALREQLRNGEFPRCLQRAIKQPETVHVYQDKKAKSECLGCPLADIRNGNSAMVRALAFDSQLFGILCVAVPPPFESDKEGIQLFDEVAQDMAFALHKLTMAEELRQAERQYRELFEDAPVGIFRTCSTGKVLQINPAMARMLGAESTEQAKAQYTDLAKQLYVRPERREEFLDILRREDKVDNFAFEAKTLDGGTVWLEMIAHIADRQEDGTFTIDGFVIDVTKRKHAEIERDQLYSQVVQTERMNAVGRLAGGVAHDFNNLLMGMMNYVELCREASEGNPQMRQWLDQITTDAQRSADLTRQLLAFARKQNITPQAVDLNDAIASMLKMLRRLIGEDIELAWRPTPDIAPVYIDPSQIDQILANLVVNARDAIAGVGHIIIETRNVQFDEDYCAEHPGFVDGEFAMLAVSDNGCGMDEKTMDQVFEPFFTTKPTGEGTGLGLATVYGIVKQNEGFINVYSEPNKGTMFRIYLPRYQEEPVAQTEQKEESPAQIASGTETILLVEDELAVRKTTQIFLQRMGYTVIPADNPHKALELAEQCAETIDLLITDVVMPGMSGRDLAATIAEQFPAIKCLYMSGYTADVIAHRGILEKDVAFLGKPFTRDDLAQKVREVLSS